ncbi:MAG: ATP-binding protein, partial [Bacteroidales bacterium]|nr:ATP-binding protein [Bacteroidales bacterium]
MFQHVQKLLREGHSKEEILYFNFEDDRLSELELKDLDLIKKCYEELFETTPIFFLDEIQTVSGWEKFARRLADGGFRVYVTGSNAKMLSSEIATTLGGRFMIQNVFPYSFSEFLRASGIDIKEKNILYKQGQKIEKRFESYFVYGGLPELSKADNKRLWLSNLFQKIFFGDIITRYQIRNDFALKVLIKKLAESVKQPSSFNRLANIVSSTGKKITTDTTIDYVEYLKDSWLIFSLENIAAKLQDKESNKKYYFMDNGVLNLFLFDAHASLLENLVAITLYKQHGDNVYFYNHNIEVDFYLPDSKTAIQVAYSIKDVKTRKREIDALSKLSGRLDVEHMFIITKEE